jgi:hypothetical protein
MVDVSVRSRRFVVENIGAEGVEYRLVRSVIAFGTTLAAIVALRALAAPAWAFAFLLVPFWGAFSLAYQALFRT